MEIQRCANIVPTGVQHVNSRDITVNGLTIPANSMIQPLLTNILKVCIISTTKLLGFIRRNFIGGAQNLCIVQC